MGTDPFYPGPRNLITDVAGLRVGHAEAPEFGTGTTVILPDEMAVAGVDVRGGGPGTRETELLGHGTLLNRVDAVVLSGGSAHGLDAASGVSDALRRAGRGLTVGGSTVPIVPAAILFDLPFVADPSAADTLPYHALGVDAFKAAAHDMALGNSGAGYGARTADGKGGLGSASLVWEDGDTAYTVGAIVAVNAIGSVLLPGTRAFLARPWEIGAEFGDVAWPDRPPRPTGFPTKRDLIEGGNTTIALVATDAPLIGDQARRFAMMAQDGIARAIHPAHTPFDGDTVFALATAKAGSGAPAGITPRELTVLGGMAATSLARAIARGVYEARSLGGFPAWYDGAGFETDPAS